MSWTPYSAAIKNNVEEDLRADHPQIVHMV